MTHLALLLGLILAILSTPIQAGEISPPKPDHDRFTVSHGALLQAASALGFVTAQNATLDAIGRQYPDLAPQANALRQQFQAQYSFPEQRARWFLEYAMGEEEAAEQVTHMREQAESLSVIDSTHAQLFLAEMMERLEGHMSIDELKAMLWLAYPDNGDTEMHKWTQEFTSAGHPKTADLTVTLRVPLSWKQAEGDRPHIISKWTSQNGTGDMVATLLVSEVPGHSFEADMQAYNDDDLDEFVPERFTLLDATRIEIDREPGLQMNMIGNSRVLDIEVIQRVALYTVFPPDRMMQFGCTLLATEDEEEARQIRRFEAMKRTCRRIAATIVFPDTYL